MLIVEAATIATPWVPSLRQETRETWVGGPPTNLLATQYKYKMVTSSNTTTTRDALSTLINLHHLPPPPSPRLPPPLVYCLCWSGRFWLAHSNVSRMVFSLFHPLLAYSGSACACVQASHPFHPVSLFHTNEPATVGIVNTAPSNNASFFQQCQVFIPIVC
jgi:hypothetical protein